MAFTSSLARCWTCQRNTRTNVSWGGRNVLGLCYSHLSGGKYKLISTYPRSSSALPTATYTSEASSSAAGEGNCKKSKARSSKGAPLPTGTTQEQSDHKTRQTKQGRTRSSDADEADDVPKKAGAKKKAKKSSEISDQMMKEQLIGPFVPFEGTCATNTMQPNMNNTNNLHNGSLSVISQDSLEGRLYHIRSNDVDKSMYSFPSVTTILDSTVGRGSYYRLLNWKRKLTAQHGTEGFEEIVKNTLNSGSNFHKVCGMIQTFSPLKPTFCIQDLERELLQLSQSRTRENSTSNSQSELSKESSPVESLEPSAASPSREVADEGTQSSTLEQSTAEPPATSDSGSDRDEEASNRDEEASDRNEEASDEPLASQHMQSVEHVLRDIGRVVALETPVAHLELGYVGTFDCLAEYQGRLCLIDWKTSTRPRPTLADCYDYPLQAVAYAGAINQDSSISDKVLYTILP